LIWKVFVVALGHLSASGLAARLYLGSKLQEKPVTARTTIGLLGGARALGVNPKSAVQWVAMINAGLPVSSADALQRAIGVPNAVLAQLLGISEMSLGLARLRGGNGRLDFAISGRLLRVARIVALAIQMLESEPAALRWLMHPRFELGSRAPLALMTTDAGGHLVERLLLRAEHRVCA
jgi:putative toxin-antitoxin system antitoxin component (TIGR02293 family)